MRWLELLLESFATKHFSDYDPDLLPSWELLCTSDYGAFFGVPLLIPPSDLRSLPLTLPVSSASAIYEKDLSHEQW